MVVKVDDVPRKMLQGDVEQRVNESGDDRNGGLKPSWGRCQTEEFPIERSPKEVPRRSNGTVNHSTCLASLDA